MGNDCPRYAGRLTASRFHDISCGHRVYGHESACSHLHGHNYRITFTLEMHDGVDSVGRVLDFGVIKTLLCDWVERNWDHRFLAWVEDPMGVQLKELDSTVVRTPFNPTAENMAAFLVRVVGPSVLPAGVVLAAADVQETRKCSATYQRVGVRP